MWSEKRKNGNVTYIERYKDPLTGRVKTASVTIKPTGRKSDAKLAENALRDKIRGLLAITETKDVTFGTLCDKYIEWQERTHKHQTAVSAADHLTAIRRSIGDDVLVNRLTAPIVTGRIWTDNPVTYNERLTRFKALMRWAYRSDYVQDIAYLDKMQKSKAPTTREKDAAKYLEHEEIEKLLSGMTVWKWKLMTEFLILSGLRVGEAIALEDSDVNTGTREISVTKTRSPNTNEISTTKTETSERIVYMQDELLQVCCEIKKSMKEEQIKYAYRTSHFMSDDDGNYLCYQSYAKYFRENTEHLIGRRLTPHSLRHTHTALMAEAGVPIETISRRLGHADSKITMDVYMHVTNSMVERDRDRIKSVKMLTIC